MKGGVEDLLGFDLKPGGFWRKREYEIRKLWKCSFGSFLIRMRILANGLQVWGNKIKNKIGKEV